MVRGKLPPASRCARSTTVPGWRRAPSGAATIRAEGGGRERRRAALIPYLTAGYPTPATCIAALRLAEAAGADFVEVGVPFSDPLADGPTIQRSTQAALAQGITVARVLELVGEAQLGIPIVIMTYLNPVLAYGVGRFLADAHAAGASGLLLTDFPAGSDSAVRARGNEVPA